MAYITKGEVYVQVHMAWWSGCKFNYYLLANHINRIFSATTKASALGNLSACVSFRLHVDCKYISLDSMSPRHMFYAKICL